MRYWIKTWNSLDILKHTLLTIDPWRYESLFFLVAILVSISQTFFSFSMHALVKLPITNHQLIHFSSFFSVLCYFF